MYDDEVQLTFRRLQRTRTGGKPRRLGAVSGHDVPSMENWLATVKQDGRFGGNCLASVLLAIGFA
jgi:hypothetical protein